jgi:hypothetical protein
MKTYVGAACSNGREIHGGIKRNGARKRMPRRESYF